MPQHKLIISANNSKGVLVRIALILARYNYNIESAVASKATFDKSRGTITIKITGDPAQLNLTVKQIEKLIDVTKVKVA